MEDFHVKDRKIIEDFYFLFALKQLLKSVICKIFITGQINGIVAQNSNSSQFLVGVLKRHLDFLGLGDA